MNRISEKVRDIVNVRPYTTVEDFLREPEATIANYHFTDVTAYMMGGWISSVNKRNPEEMCRAIAGFRGVGKSHFLAAFAALLSHPELRSRIADAHVLSSSQELMRRHYPVINVRRGLGETLLEEIRDAVCFAYDIRSKKTGVTVAELIETIIARSSGLTPIIIFDSAHERTAPVDRNDGQVLAEMAEQCAARGVFVGLALDDDIAGADGSNAVISTCFKIEYLDPENLYKILNTHIFPKNPRTQDLLRSLYDSFRAKVPDFRWSEQRFSSLYPLHPATLDLAPFIRSYLPKFALFGFASSAGEKILGRPADSLIGIDDVFDVIEYDLRKVKELNEAFRAFDAATMRIGTEMPVAGRHMAKLVLKVLFLNSLSQRGISANEIAGSIMLTESSEPGSSVRDIDSMLNGYANNFPHSISADRSHLESVRYSFNIGSDEFTEQLNLLVADCDPATPEIAFRAAVAERFPELSDVILSGADQATLFTEWRGSRRPGRIRLSSTLPPNDSGTHRLDWEVHLGFFDNAPSAADASDGLARIEWKTGNLTAEDRRSLTVHSALSANKELRAKFPDQFSTSIISAATAVSTSVERIMVADALLTIDGFDYNFSEAARSHTALPQMIGAMLEPLFEAVYPEHPYFIDPLDEDIVDRFVKCLADGESSATAADKAALTFGVPLGIVEYGESGYGVVSKERLLQLPMIAPIVELIEASPVDPPRLTDVENCLAKPPVGLSLEATKLALSAMALRGLVELITAEGERIAGRSIDLKLDWSTIVSVSPPNAATVSPEKSLEWARLITGEQAIVSLTDADDRAQVLEAFVEIAAQWERRNPFEAFEKIPDCEFNTTLWRHSNRTWDAYAAMVTNINEALIGDISLEECIDRVRSNFLDRPDAFHDSRYSVTAIEDFVRAFPDTQRVANYLALAGNTTDGEVEAARERLRMALRRVSSDPTEHVHREVGYAWEKFHRLYSVHYAGLHSEFCNIGDFRRFAEKTLGGDEWARFYQEAALSGERQRVQTPLRAIKRKLLALQCTLDPLPYLKTAPFCRCGFRLSDIGTANDLANDLRSLSGNISENPEDVLLNVPAPFSDVGIRVE